MIVIQYSKEDTIIKNWKEKLKDLVVAHRFEQTEKADQPVLIDKGQQIVGVKAINGFIDQLEKDIIEWRKPGCGK